MLLESILPYHPHVKPDVRQIELLERYLAFHPRNIGCEQRQTSPQVSFYGLVNRRALPPLGYQDGLLSVWISKNHGVGHAVSIPVQPILPRVRLVRSALQGDRPAHTRCRYPNKA